MEEKTREFFWILPSYYELSDRLKQIGGKNMPTLSIVYEAELQSHKRRANSK